MTVQDNPDLQLTAHDARLTSKLSDDDVRHWERLEEFVHLSMVFAVDQAALVRYALAVKYVEVRVSVVYHQK